MYQVGSDKNHTLSRVLKQFDRKTIRIRGVVGACPGGGSCGMGLARTARAISCSVITGCSFLARSIAVTVRTLSYMPSRSGTL